jgi:hypothetical protein
MSSSSCGQESLDHFAYPSATTTTENLSGVSSNAKLRIPVKRLREDSDPESDSEEMEADRDRMDFQHSENITATQAIGDVDDHPEHGISQLPPPLSAEHAALRSDFEIITLATTKHLYRRIIANL